MFRNSTCEAPYERLEGRAYQESLKGHVSYSRYGHRIHHPLGSRHGRMGTGSGHLQQTIHNLALSLCAVST